MVARLHTHRKASKMGGTEVRDDLAVFLLSDAASFVTSRNVLVDLKGSAPGDSPCRMVIVFISCD